MKNTFTKHELEILRDTLAEIDYNEVSEMYRSNLHKIARDGNYEYPTSTEVFNIVFSVVVEAISEQMSVENGGIYAEWRDSGMVEVSYKQPLPRYQ